jgi:hypothetical protein
MTNGAKGCTASLRTSTRRDVQLTKAAQKKNKCVLEAEAKNIDKALKALEKRKLQCTNALEMRRKRQQQQQQQMMQQQE